MDTHNPTEALFCSAGSARLRRKSDLEKMKSDVKQQPESNLESDTSPEYAAAPAAPAGNLIIWILAWSPLVGIFLELAGLALIGLPIPIIPDIIALPLSIYLAYVDRKKLKAAGHDTSRLGPPWLVPVYLFKRARMLNHKMTYLLVWCGLCGVLVLL